MRQHTISTLVENRPGVLARIAGMFARRGFNIESLAVGTTEDPEVSRMTITVTGDRRAIEQVEKQLDKLVEVLRVRDITDTPRVEREIALFKVKASKKHRSEIMAIVDIFRGNIVDITPDAVMIEITGDEEKIAALEEITRPYGILELVRTGKIALVRGSLQT